MQLIHKHEQMVLSRNETAITTIIEKVSELIESKELVFSHLLIDGEEVFEDHEQFINDRINDIKRIEIVTYTVKEMIWEMVKTADDYFKRAIPALEQIVETSYDTFTEATWNQIGQLTEGLEWLLQFRAFVDEAKEQPKDWNQFVATFSECQEHFEPLVEAMEAEDTILISDLLAYEITPAFEQMAMDIDTILSDDTFLTTKN